MRQINEFTGKPHSHRWKGGSVATSGYKLIYVGKSHHLADVRGYAYEHRIIAEKEAGRLLAKGEQVHHEDETKLNNAPDNLEIKASRAEHALSHRKRKDLRRPGEANPQVACFCGCGQKFPKFDKCRRPRKYVSGHNHQKRKSNGSYIN